MRFLLPAFLVLTAGSVAMASPGPYISAQSFDVWWTLARIALLALFLFASVAAFKIPGTGVPELLAVGLLTALLVPSFIRGDAAWYEMVLIAAGLLLIGVELFVIPGFGATGVGGILLLAVGLLLVFLPAASPTHSISLVDLRNALVILVGGSFAGILSFAWMSHHFPAATGTSKLVLRETNATAMPDHLWPSVGDVGVALTDLKPGGVVQLPDFEQTMQRVDVVSKRGFIPAGSRIVVTEVVGQVIGVKPKEELIVDS
jgi:membrane-bound serine protease (ClpP class)